MSLIYQSWILFHVLFIIPRTHGGFGDYCDVNCNGNKHTVCMRQDEECKPASACRNPRTDMDDDVRQMILDKHNEYRNEVAIGTSGQPKAANMNALRWNFELEYIAQCLANTCEFEHDKCRDTREHHVGQNLAIASGTDPNHPENIEVTLDAIADWYAEKKDMKSNVIDSFYSPGGPAIGHYTQLAWADVEFVGCGRIRYRAQTSIPHTMYLVCNYMGTKSSGNLLGARMYIRGEPCSQCGDKECNSEYPGLCGKTVPVSAEEGRNTAGRQAGVNTYFMVYILLVVVPYVFCYNDM